MSKRKATPGEAMEKVNKIIKSISKNSIVCWSDGSAIESNPGYAGCGCVVEIPRNIVNMLDDLRSNVSRLELKNMIINLMLTIPILNSFPLVLLNLCAFY